MAIFQEQGGTRSRPISSRLETLLNAAASSAGVDIHIFSGGQAALGSGPRERSDHTGSTRHDLGNAADLTLTYNGRKLSENNPADLPIIQEFVRAAVENGATGIGAGAGYMGVGRIHVGFDRTEKKGVGLTLWGPGETSKTTPRWLKDAVSGHALAFKDVNHAADPFGVVRMQTAKDAANDMAAGAPSRTLRLTGSPGKGRMTGPDVAALGQKLSALGYDVGSPADVFGPKMQAAVRSFERDKGLPTQDAGIAGPQIQAALGFGAPPAYSPGGGLVAPEFPSAWGVPPPQMGPEAPDNTEASGHQWGWSDPLGIPQENAVLSGDKRGTTAIPPMGFGQYGPGPDTFGRSFPSGLGPAAPNTPGYNPPPSTDPGSGALEAAMGPSGISPMAFGAPPMGAGLPADPMGYPGVGQPLAEPPPYEQSVSTPHSLNSGVARGAPVPAPPWSPASPGFPSAWGEQPQATPPAALTSQGYPFQSSAGRTRASDASGTSELNTGLARTSPEAFAAGAFPERSVQPSLADAMGASSAARANQGPELVGKEPSPPDLIDQVGPGVSINNILDTFGLRGGPPAPAAAPSPNIQYQPADTDLSQRYPWTRDMLPAQPERSYPGVKDGSAPYGWPGSFAPPDVLSYGAGANSLVGGAGADQFDPGGAKLPAAGDQAAPYMYNAPAAGSGLASGYQPPSAPLGYGAPAGLPAPPAAVQSAGSPGQQLNHFADTGAGGDQRFASLGGGDTSQFYGATSLPYAQMGTTPWGSPSFGAPYGQAGSSNSPYTPTNWNAPNFSPISGGALNSWDPETRTYLTSDGRRMSMD